MLFHQGIEINQAIDFIKTEQIIDLLKIMFLSEVIKNIL